MKVYTDIDVYSGAVEIAIKVKSAEGTLEYSEYYKTGEEAIAGKGAVIQAIAKDKTRVYTELNHDQEIGLNIFVDCMDGTRLTLDTLYTTAEDAMEAKAVIEAEFKAYGGAA